MITLNNKKQDIELSPTMRTLLVVFLALASTSFINSDFLTEQKRFERVKTAYAEKYEMIKTTLTKNHINVGNLNLLLIAYKEEQIIDLYAKNLLDKKYIKIATYEICTKSGLPGPKNQSGDCQVPEGFYYIDRFNPTSDYYLSLRINYPNEADKKRSTALDKGGDIFIHGECVTIGCLPMTTDKIKEIYIYALQARQSGQVKIPVYIFPFKMTKLNMQSYNTKYSKNPVLGAFWNNLKVGYDKFFDGLIELTPTTNKKGEYSFN
jgi:murein L,D-transpeptidase YafK